MAEAGTVEFDASAIWLARSHYKRKKRIDSPLKVSYHVAMRIWKTGEIKNARCNE